MFQFNYARVEPSPPGVRVVSFQKTFKIPIFFLKILRFTRRDLVKNLGFFFSCQIFFWWFPNPLRSFWAQGRLPRVKRRVVPPVRTKSSEIAFFGKSLKSGKRSRTEKQNFPPVVFWQTGVSPNHSSLSFGTPSSLVKARGGAACPPPLDREISSPPPPRLHFCCQTKKGAIATHTKPAM